MFLLLYQQLLFINVVHHHIFSDFYQMFLGPTRNSETCKHTDSINKDQMSVAFLI